MPSKLPIVRPGQDPPTCVQNTLWAREKNEILRLPFQPVPFHRFFRRRLLEGNLAMRRQFSFLMDFY